MNSANHLDIVFTSEGGDYEEEKYSLVLFGMILRLRFGSTVAHPSEPLSSGSAFPGQECLAQAMTWKRFTYVPEVVRLTLAQKIPIISSSSKHALLANTL